MASLTDLPATSFNYKYDLMHLTTPPFATAFVEWDLSKVGRITKNRVIKWLRTGTSPDVGGNSHRIHYELTKDVRLPTIRIAKAGKYYLPHDPIDMKHILVRHLPDYVAMEIKKLCDATLAILRMQDNEQYEGYLQYHYSHAEKQIWGNLAYPYQGQADICQELPLDDLNAAIERMLKSDEYHEKIACMIEKLERGDKMYFRYQR